MLSPGMQTIQEQRQKIKNSLLAGMVPETLRSLKWEQRAVEATQQAAHKATFREDMTMPDDDDGTVNVDSPTTINYYNNDGSASQQQPRSSLLGTAAKAALAFGLLGTGVGAGAAVPLILDVLKDFRSGTTIESESTIIRTEQGPRYLLGLGEPETEP
jgi:hypothetical protein